MTMIATPTTTRRLRLWIAVSAPAVLAAGAGAITVIVPTGTANADVCVGVGRHVHVSGCANVADALTPYVPPPAAYAPLPEDPAPNVHGCIGYDGRWVSADRCN